MIGFLEGSLIESSGKAILLNVSGVGYRLFVTTDTIERAQRKKEEKLAFYTYLAVRENALDLFGFLTKKELEFFELLITIPGIGPKSALAILGVSSVETLSSAIASGDTAYLTKISGIGRKTAEKIVLELRGKTGAETESSRFKDENDVMEALKSLGYNEREIREVLKKMPPGDTGTSGRIKEALRLLGR